MKVDVVIAERPGLKGKACELYQLARKYLPPEARERLSTTVDILEMPKGEPTDDEKPAVLLQAADIVAYELGQYAQGKDRYPMRQLMKTDEHYYWHIFDKGLLNAACQTWTPD